MLKTWPAKFLQAAAALLPEQCQRCDRLLGFSERLLCNRCFSEALEQNRQDDWLPVHRPVLNFPVLAAAAYHDGVATLLFSPKRFARWRVAQRVADSVYESLPLNRPFESAESRLLAVPSHKRETWKRGYKPAGLVADLLADAYEYRSSPLRLRKRQRVQQKARSRAERLKLLPRAFSLLGNPKHPVILVDDVCGSGATLAACANVVRQAGGTVTGAVVMFARPEEQA